MSLHSSLATFRITLTPANHNNAGQYYAGVTRQACIIICTIVSERLLPVRQETIEWHDVRHRSVTAARHALRAPRANITSSSIISLLQQTADSSS